MSDDNYWWQSIDNDEHWQWEQMQRMNSIGKPSSGNPTPNGNLSTNEANPNGPNGQEKAA